jgi:NADH-quinone oxidoreductase subunit F
MNFKQIYAAAEDESHYLEDRDCLKIYIGALADNDTAPDVFRRFQAGIDKHSIKARVIVTGSFGYYDLEPLVLVEKPGQAAVLYRNVTPETATVLVNDYLIGDNPRPDMALGILGDNKIDSMPSISDLPLFNLQNRIALRNCGYLDPQSISHYILKGQGYAGLARALAMSRREVIEELKKSGLRGRGGAGYLTADKWQACHDAEGNEKYVICNAVDADPQALTARLILESDPHSVLEGVLIGAYAVGAEKGIICVNAEHPAAVERLKKALEQMREYGLLGSDILGSTLSCEIEIKEVPASLVAGEETALLRFLEGKQAMPYIRPPHPVVSGFMGKATLINNLETMANVAAIFQNGGEWYAASGTEQSKGTKVITLAGDIVRKYTVEVPFGTTLRSVVADIGSGVSNGKDGKAVQFGGPTGAYFSAGSLDIPIDYETVAEAGSTIGSGTVAVFNGDTCAVEMARDAIAYLHSQSCGKCVFCREGSYQMSDILQDIAEYRGTFQDLDLLVELGEGMREGCICNLGRTASNPVLSSIKLFPPDYDAHIKEKRCPLDGKSANNSG